MRPPARGTHGVTEIRAFTRSAPSLTTFGGLRQPLDGTGGTVVDGASRGQLRGHATPGTPRSSDDRWLRLGRRPAAWEQRHDLGRTSIAAAAY